MSQRARVVVGLLCVVVLVSIAAPVGGQSTPRAGIGGVGISGSGVIDTPSTPNGSTYLWLGESVNASVTVADYPAANNDNNGNYGVCLRYKRPNRPAKKLVDKCAPLSLADGTNGTAEFANVTWPANTSGRQRLVVQLRNRSIRSNTTVLDNKTVPVTVLRKGGDLDRDGLTNAREIAKGYNVSNSDMDSDGLQDGAEVNKYHTDPQKADTDGDGIRDGVELQRGTDPTKPDTDGDGLSDSTERTIGTNPNSDLTPVWLVVVALVVVGVVVGVVVALRRGWRRLSDGWTNGPEANANGGGTGGNEADPPPESGTDPPPESVEHTPEPLTDEDRVLGLLRQHGGRMKQTRIVEETEWSKAKVSRLLSSMNDEGAIDKLSIGRENIISLDGHGPEAAGSPPEENASD